MRKLLKVFYFLKYKLRNNLPKYFFKLLARFRSKKQPNTYLEQRKSFGELNPTKIFYVIRRRPPGWGFFSNIFFVLQGLDYAAKNGYIPIVDMEHYWIGELSSLRKINGTYNAWCYFFNQVSKYSIEEVYKSKNVILSNGSNILGKDNWLTNRNIIFATNYDLLKRANSILSKSVSLNTETLKYLHDLKSELNWKSEQTLGVFIRGTPYFQDIHFPDSTIPNLDYFISEVKNLLSRKSLKYMYISTEDYRVYKKLSSEFSNIEIVPSIRYNSLNKIMDWESSQKMSHVDGLVKMNYEKTLPYLAEIYLLISCADFIGTFSNASAFILASRNLDLGDNFLVLQGKSLRIKAETK